MPSRRNRTIFTIGHSTRPLEELAGLLKAHGVKILADIRTIPRSRHNPQFNEENLRQALPGLGVDYVRIEELGGLRKPLKDSPNTGWRNASFRGYADHMATPEFARGLHDLMALGEKDTAAVMCAEAVPWRCHRSLVADAFAVHGWRVLHIQGKTAPKEHQPTPFLRVRQDGSLVYPGSGQPPLGTYKRV